MLFKWFFNGGVLVSRCKNTNFPWKSTKIWQENFAKGNSFQTLFQTLSQTLSPECCYVAWRLSFCRYLLGGMPTVFVKSREK